METRPPANGEKGLWLISAAVALVVVTGLSFLFLKKGAVPVTTKPIERPATPAAPPLVGLTRIGGAEQKTLLNEEATLLDPTPLYMPTQWNAGQNTLPAELNREPGGQFTGYGSNLMFSEADLKFALRDVVPIPAQPESLAAGIPAQTFLGMGERDVKTPILPARGAYVEVTTAEGGRVIFSRALADANPPAWGDGQPLSFLIAVDKAGLVGSPVLLKSSFVATVDKYFEDYLEKALHIGERVGPGFYRISFGP